MQLILEDGAHFDSGLRPLLFEDRFTMKILLFSNIFRSYRKRPVA